MIALRPQLLGVLSASLSLVLPACQERDRAGVVDGTRETSSGAKGKKGHALPPKVEALADAPDASPPPAPRGTSFKVTRAVKVEQLIGDYDKERRAPTRQKTLTRYQVGGTDLGHSFEHDGAAYFLFGDTIPHGGDVIGKTTSTDPEKMVLDFVVGANGRPVAVQPDRKRMAGFEVPVAGISVLGKAYVACKIDHSGDLDKPTDLTVLTEWDTRANTWKTLRTISKLPSGHFSIVAFERAPGPLEKVLGGAHVLMFGTGFYRRSHPYLAVVPSATFASGEKTRYFCGLGRQGAHSPKLCDTEAEATPLFEHPTMANLSVVHVPELGKWLMLYDSREPRGIVARLADAPWGPWSGLELVFDPKADGGLGKFIHVPGAPNDGQAGPIIGDKKKDAEATHGGAYAPYIVQRFTRVSGRTVTFYFTLSVWNPYTVEWMRASIDVP